MSSVGTRAHSPASCSAIGVYQRTTELAGSPSASHSFHKYEHIHTEHMRHESLGNPWWIKSSKCLSSLQLGQCSSSRSSVLGLTWPECVGSSWMMKALMLLTSTATDCSGAYWCPHPGLGGELQGHHPPIYQGHEVVGSSYRKTACKDKTESHKVW